MKKISLRSRFQMATPAKSVEAPKLSKRLEEAGVPRQVDREFIATLGEVTWLRADAAEARNPQTGELGDGMMVLIQADNGKQYTSFVGNVALLRILGQVDFPFRAAIVKKGRTWAFTE
jgi:hypothetical protein